MPRYTFTFKKDDIFVEFTTEDKEIVERQFQIWVASADDYVNNRPIKTFVTPKKVKNSQSKPQVVTETASEEPIIEAHEGQEEVQPESVQSEQVSVEEKIAMAVETNEDVVVDEVISEESAEVFDTASTLLKTINNIQNPPVDEPKPEVNFEDVLEKSIENPTFEPNKAKDQIFLNLIRTKNTTDKFHYLIITAYYLLEFEKMERFSLKQINSKLMYNMSEIVDHGKLQEAINQGLIELVPDLTGISEVDEYKLTQAGEDFFANKI